MVTKSGLNKTGFFLENMVTKKYIIYTDGGCNPNPGLGGWGSVILTDNSKTELYGGEYDTTNNRMELLAAIFALSVVKEDAEIEVFTDSQYLKNGITAWIPGWKSRGWSRKGGSLKNVDLWQKLDNLNSSKKIKWQWVRGHSGNHYNERCDFLAGMARKALMNNSSCFSEGYKIFQD